MARAKKAKAEKKVPSKRGKAKSAKSSNGVVRGKDVAVSRSLSPKAAAAVRKATEVLWGAGEKPHTLLQELHEVLLLRCLEAAEGNYAAAASLFGPSRQSVQQYANSSLRDDRWRPYQQNRRKKRGA